MLKEAEDELMKVLGWLSTDVASTTHLNRLKRALGRTDMEGTMGLNETTYPGDPGPQTPPAEPVAEPAAEPVPEAPAEAPAEAPVTEEPAAEAAPTE